MIETKDRMFTEWVDNEDFIGVGITGDPLLEDEKIVMYWKTEKDSEAPVSVDGFDVIHKIIGEISMQVQ